MTLILNQCAILCTCRRDQEAEGGEHPVRAQQEQTGLEVEEDGRETHEAPRHAG